ncbi:MAG: hemolysin family protein [Bacteroidia bacterium]|jgi:CBS domain containing-hemolysin-like protein|nr:hemolysin family protein [Bacteroidia bacterium]
MISDLLFALFLVLLNGFFVAAEFAIVKVRHSQIELKAGQGHNLARISQHIVSHLDGYLSACQLGITLASLALGWIGEPVVASLIQKGLSLVDYAIPEENLHHVSIVAGFSLITVLHIVLGELIPKTVAIRKPLATTFFIAAPLRFIYILFMPFIWLLNGLSILILKLLGLHAVDHSEIHSEEELRMILTESEEGGAIKPSEHELIQNVFEFDDRVVRQIYVPRTRVVALDIDDSFESIADRVFEEGYSRHPVYKDSIDNIVGILHSKDLYLALRGKKPRKLEALLRPAYYVPLSMQINELLRQLQKQHMQMAIVTNEFGGTEGIVTMEDVIEELVGEIQDEYDEEKPAVEKKSETEFIVNATASIGDVNDLLPIALSESPEYETVSGLVNVIFGGIPAVHEKIKFGGYEITILKRFKHSVEQVRLKIVDNESLNSD